MFFRGDQRSVIRDILTINPGERLHFEIPWDFTFDNGKYLQNYCDPGSTEYFFIGDPNVYWYQYYLPQNVRARFTASVIPRTPAAIAEHEFVVTLIGYTHSYEPGHP